MIELEITKFLDEKALINDITPFGPDEIKMPAKSINWHLTLGCAIN